MVVVRYIIGRSPDYGPASVRKCPAGGFGLRRGGQGKAEDDGVLKAPRIQAAEAVDPVELILHRVFVKKKRLACVGKRLVFLKINAEQGEVVRVLLSADGADPNVLNDDGESPLFLAVHRGALNIVEMLLEAGADTSVSLNTGDRPLHVAAVDGSHYIGKVLIASGADVNARNSSGSTPLILAARNGRNDFTEMLLQNGADPDMADNDGLTAMHYASEAGFTEIVEQLLMAGAKG